MTSPLENLSGPTGTLDTEPADADEFERLVRAGSTMLADAGIPTVSHHGRFLSAYAAAHAFCLAALRYRGYRPRNQRYVVFQVLPHTLGLGPEVWRVLAEAHRMRNLAEYAGDLDVSERFLVDLIAATRIVQERIQAMVEIDERR